MQLIDSKAQILQQCLDAVDAHKLDVIRSLYSPTAQIDAPGAQLRGADQILGWYGVFVTAFPDLKHEIRAALQQADTRVLQARVSGTHTGPLASPASEIAPTGKAFALAYVNVARFADGRIMSETYYLDNQASERRCEKSSRWLSEAVEHDADHGQVDECLAAGGQDFVVFAQPTPRDSATQLSAPRSTAT